MKKKLKLGSSSYHTWQSHSEMLSRNVLVTGASRGLGLELVKQLVKNPENQPNRSPAKVIATCRNPGNADELMELASEEKDRLFVKALDVLNYDSFPDFVNNDIKVCHDIMRLFSSSSNKDLER